MTARGSGLRIWWDCHRGCCEAGPPPSMPRCRVSIHENPERILWLRKRRRRRRPRRRRPRSRRRSEFWPGWSAQLRPGSQLRVRFGEWRALGSAFLLSTLCSRRPCERRDPYAAAYRLMMELVVFAITNGCGYGSLRPCAIAHKAGTTCGEDSAQHPRHALRGSQRSANASLAPSAAKPAAKLRRSQAIAFGRVITRSRSEAANRP